MNAEQRAALEATFKALAPAQAERWSRLLDRKPSAWSKIDPIAAWPTQDEYESSPNVPTSVLLRSPPLAAHLETPCVVLRCGHSKNPGVSTLPLKLVCPNGEWDYDVVFEGFISVVPGKLAVVLNHEGGTWLFTKQLPASGE